MWQAHKCWLFVRRLCSKRNRTFLAVFDIVKLYYNQVRNQDPLNVVNSRVICNEVIRSNQLINAGNFKLWPAKSENLQNEIEI